jgi:phage-related protein
MVLADKPLFVLSGAIRTPPLSTTARQQAGYLLRLLQKGERLAMPISRSMPGIGRRCHELRIRDSDTDKTWRLIYRIETDAVLVVDVFAKKTQTTPRHVIDTCKDRLREYDDATS